MIKELTLPLINLLTDPNANLASQSSKSPRNPNFEGSINRKTCPSHIFLSNTSRHRRNSSASSILDMVSSVPEIFAEISSHINQKFAATIHIPYCFTDVKVLKRETHAIGVTNEGYCVYLDLHETDFSEVLLTKSGLSGVLPYSNDQLALVKEMDQGKVYQLELPSMSVIKIIKIAGEGNNGIGRMCFSPNEAYCYARLWKGEVIRWKVSDFDKHEVMLNDKNIVCMNVSPDGQIVIGTIDKKISIYNPAFEKVNEKSFDFKVDAYISFSVTGHLIVLAMDVEVKLINKSTLEIINSFYCGCQSSDCIITENNQYLIAPLETGEVAFFDITNNKPPLKIKSHNSSIKSLYLSSDQSEIFTFGSDFKLGRIRFPEISHYKPIPEGNFTSNTALSSGRSQENQRDTLESQISERRILDPDDSFKALCLCESLSQDIVIVGGQSSKILVWDVKSSKKVGNLLGHEDYVYAVECISDEIVASGSGDYNVKIWNFRHLTLICTLAGHSDTVTSLASIDVWRIASGSKDRSVKIWAWEERTVIFNIDEFSGPVYSLLLAEEDFIIIGLSASFQCWELKSYTLVFEKNSECEVNYLKSFTSETDGKTKEFIGFGVEDISLCFENPFLTKKLKILGKDEYSEYQYMLYLKDIISYKLPPYNIEMDKWVIFPYMVNTLHFYAYFDMPDYLYLAILNGGSLLNTSTEENALSIAIEQRNKDCIHSIIKSVHEKQAKNPYLISNTKLHSLLSLNSWNISSLPKLYSLLIINYNAFQKYCPAEINLPIIKSSFSQIILTKHIVPEIESHANEVEARFCRSAISLHLEIGSSQSIEFLNSICKCEQIKIFASDIIQKTVDYKWDKVKWLLYLESSVFAGMYIMLIVNSLFFEHIGLIAVAEFLGLMIFIEHILVWGISLRFSLWTAVDIVRFLALSIQFITCLADVCYTEILVTALIASSLEGLYYFKLWKGTRKLISIIIRVGYDIFSFLMVLSYLLISIGSILHIIAIQNDIKPINSLSFITISENSYEEFFENIFLVFMTFINPIIMLNILLALSAENYNKSEEVSKALDYKEAAQIILKVEYLYFHKRKESNQEYLQICAETKMKKVGKLKKLSKIVKSVKKSQDTHQVQMICKMQGFEEKMKSLETLMMSIKEIKPIQKRKT